jgi:cobaltochelatase CobS
MTINKNKIKCEICGKETHVIEKHLAADHPGYSLAQYEQNFPGKPVLSPYALQIIEEKRNKSVVTQQKRSIAEMFNLDPSLPGLLNARKEPIMASYFKTEHQDLVPDVDESHVFDIETLKNVLMALELNIPLMLWGHTGTGKTSLLAQVAARTNRPMVRVQHTINTEESHIVGQWTARGGETKFELGLLALAMKHGWLYVADEYDFALPSVLSVYQPVLEGAPLIIKEADAWNRVIKPHPNFRFAATGNTNGSGDASNIYQGTSIQNAANYDRFNMVVEVNYMPTEQEVEAIVKKTGIPRKDAQDLVEFASRVRESFATKKISTPVSTRALIRIADIGIRKGANYRDAINLAYSNKLPEVDKEVVNGLSQRIFG